MYIYAYRKYTYIYTYEIIIYIIIKKLNNQLRLKTTEHLFNKNNGTF